MRAAGLGWLLALVPLSAALAQIPPAKGSQPGDLDGGALIQSAITRCRTCHDRDITAEPTLYTPFDGWVSTMMGNAARDPLFKAALTVANQDLPGVGSWCLRCHSPQAWMKGHTTPPNGSAFDDVDLEGVICEACHRSYVPATEPGAPYLFNAQLYWEYGVTMYGPYPNISSPAHNGAPSPFTASSELCGQCHQVQNPVGAWRDADGGTLAANFPLDTTYEEWKSSDYARLPPDAGFASCADCHLPRFIADGGSFTIGKTGPRRPAPRRHVFVGGNLWGLNAVQAANPELAVFSEQFDQTKAFVLENLAAAAALELTLPTGAVAGDTVTATVRVRNLTGHKLPSGYADGRRVLVQLRVDGEAVVGVFDGGTLVDERATRVYEVLHGRFGQGVEEHLALHDMVVKDSRLPPKGFVATLATRPFGVNWYDLADGGLASEDTFDVAVPLPAGLANGTTLNIEARLLFQSTTPAYVHFLNDQNTTDDAGQVLLDVWRQTGEAAPVEMVRAQGSISVSRPAGTGGGAGGSGGGGGGDSINPPAPCSCSSAPVAWGLFAALSGLAVRRRRQRLP